MAPIKEIRKLTAILIADVQGYSRLMGEDASHTVRMLTRCREVFSDDIRRHGERLVNAPGDSILAEFQSVVDAIQCALEIQDHLYVENKPLPEHRKMLFRIGINLGEVIQRGDDIFGDGVNLAARVQTLADGGGICATGSVFDQVKNRLDGVVYQDIGTHRVKNITEPVRVYKVLTKASSAGQIDAEAASEAAEEMPSRATTIAVLPFDNLSDNQEYGYFARGFVEDLITDLAHFPNLQVISSYTARKIGAESRDAQEAARSLGIHYLLKGNLRRQGGQIRITAQLLSADDGRILWAERYDASLETIFDIQDDIVERAVGAISAQIDKILLAAARKKPLTSLAAYDCWLRGMDLIRQGTPEADQEARKIFKQALEFDPGFSRACAGLSLSSFNDWSCQIWENWEKTEQKAYDYALEANRLDDTDYMVQMILGRILLFRGQYDLAEQHIDRSLALNSNDADCIAQISTSKTFLGKPEEGVELFLKAQRLNPYRNVWYNTYGAFNYFGLRRYNKCIETALKGPLTDVWVDISAFIAAAYAYIGDDQEAARYLQLFKDTFQKHISLGRVPDPGEIIQWMTVANPFKHDGDTRHMIDGLVLAGLHDVPDQVTAKPETPASPPESPPAADTFREENGLWQLTFGGLTVQLPEVKGFHDLARLLSQPETELHCTELTGTPAGGGPQDSVIDEKARISYQERIRDLQEDIAEAEGMNDLGRAEKLKGELEQLTDYLMKDLGIGGRSRKLDPTVERTRAAVTWRIRSAIRKIDAAHPALGRHLTNSIRTGTFCCYSPEEEHQWIT